ncbi:hypothetical protein BD779DRAFT_1673774 [Infundibulicybe gibba]|nr:hypothetical protein BD779DRAFT_1673774 [Infundibulicybe gibba]
MSSPLTDLETESDGSNSDHQERNHTYRSISAVSTTGAQFRRPRLQQPYCGVQAGEDNIATLKNVKTEEGTLIRSKEDQHIRAEAKRQVDLDEVLLLIKAKEYSQGNIYWWTCSRNSQQARDEVHEWAVEYISRFVSREARTVTQLKELQTMQRIMDEQLLTSFSFTKIYDDLRERLASVSMRIFQAFATSNQARDHTPQRQLKTKTVC